MDKAFAGFAISNIAWQSSESTQVYDLMKDYGFEGLEIAPTKLFPKPLDVPATQIASYRQKEFDSRGIKVVAMQSLLYGRPDLTIFDSPEKRQETLDYLSNLFRFGSQLGVEVAVFGSPSNRRIPDSLSYVNASTIAYDFFYRLAEQAKQYNIFVCIEPNPEFYGTNFVTDSYQAIELVKAVNHSNFRFHLDTGTLFINSENPEDVLDAGSAYLRHCHISEKALVIIAPESKIKHSAVNRALHQHQYSNWVSIEMRAAINIKESNVQNIAAALKYVKEVYGK